MPEVRGPSGYTSASVCPSSVTPFMKPFCVVIRRPVCMCGVCMCAYACVYVCVGGQLIKRGSLQLCQNFNNPLFSFHLLVCVSPIFRTLNTDCAN